VSRIERSGAWPARALWVALALVAGSTVGDALDGRSIAVRVVVLVGLWACWAVALVALLVPRTLSLTVVRALVPGGVAAVLAAVVAGSEVGALDVAALAVAVLAALAALVPWVAEEWVDGSAYGPEQRLPLRTPVVLAVAVVPATWATGAVGLVAGPLLLAARQWALGAALLVLGWALAAAAGRSLHQLSRRWVVLVPAGLVVHDPLTMPEPQLFLRRTITGLGPALVDDGRDPDGGDDPAGGGMPVDLTGGAPGLALELRVAEPVDLLLRRGRRAAETVAATAVLITPSRPTRVLDAARERRIRVG
jgi:hypothetical protein